MHVWLVYAPYDHMERDIQLGKRPKSLIETNPMRSNPYKQDSTKIVGSIKVTDMTQKTILS